MNTYSDCDLYRHLFIQDLSNRFQLKKKNRNIFFFVRDEDELENQNLKQNINYLKQRGLRLHTLDNLSVFQTPKKVIFQNLCYEEQCGLALYTLDFFCRGPHSDLRLTSSIFWVYEIFLFLLRYSIHNFEH